MAKGDKGTNINKKLEELMTVIEKVNTTNEKFNATLDRVNKRLDNLEEGYTTIKENVQNLKTNMEANKNSSNLRFDAVTNRLIRIELINSKGNLLIFGNKLKLPIHEEFKKILGSLEILDRIGGYLVYPLRSKKDKSVYGMKVAFDSISDKELLVKKLIRTKNENNLKFQNEIPKALHQLNNELLIERRRLITLGKKTYIKTLFLPPYLQLFGTDGKPFTLEDQDICANSN